MTNYVCKYVIASHTGSLIQVYSHKAEISENPKENNRPALNRVILVYEVAINQQVVCWIIRRRDTIQTPGQTSKGKYDKKNISAVTFSQQISGKNSEIK